MVIQELAPLCKCKKGHYLISIFIYIKSGLVQRNTCSPISALMILLPCPCGCRRCCVLGLPFFSVLKGIIILCKSELLMN